MSASVFGQKIPPRDAGGPAKPLVKFFPNPATTFINFEFSTPVASGHNIEIFSFLGRKMMAMPVNSSRMTINVTELFRGIYVFQLRDKNGRIVETNKFQVSK